MKRRIFILMLCAILCGCAEQTPKYIFYFIGDGMGMGQVQLTEMYLMELDGEVGNKSLSFSDFPVKSTMTTYSKSNAVTCSAASGTALATGFKTANNVLGMDAECKIKFESIAEKAKKKGNKVGIITSVTVNHATPAAFYGNQPSRDMYYELGLDAIEANFDLYAGAGVKNHAGEKSQPDIIDLMEKAGYTIARGNEDFLAKKELADKMLFIQKEGVVNSSSLQPAIDRKDGDLTLTELTEGAIDFLTKDNDKGFFMMVEGGIIDWLAHANDAASTIEETIDFSNAVAKAYEFYLKHPKETLIIITADHETGGLMLGSGSNSINLKVLENQKSSVISLSFKLKKAKKANDMISYEEVMGILTESCFGDLELTDEESARLKESYQSSFVLNRGKDIASMYALTHPMAQLAIDILSEKAKISWASNNHSASLVPVYALGVGEEKFVGAMDNALLPQIISEIAGY